jgi:ribonuclease HI
MDHHIVKPINDEALTIYTDGSSYQGPRRGGVGILFVTVDDDGHERINEYALPGYAGVTNNQMELQACIEALRRWPRVAYLSSRPTTRGSRSAPTRCT